MDRSRLSLNSITVKSLSFQELVGVATGFGIPAIAPWRDLFEAFPVHEARAILDNEGLAVSSLCRGGLFTAVDSSDRRRAIDDNLRAIDEAAVLGAQCLVLVCGPVVGKDVRGSYAMVIDGIAEILPYAAKAGVSLSLEPLHPMMAADRSVICTLGQAHAVLSEFQDPTLGVCVDAYHVWWDVDLEPALNQLAGRVRGFHVSDWVTPIQGQLSSRGMMGDGCIDLSGMAAAVARTGYDGYVEVEILSDYWWSRPPNEVVSTLVSRFASDV